MKFFKKAFLILIFLFPISNSFGAMITYVQKASVAEDAGIPRGHIQGIEFNVEGTKMFTIYRSSESDAKKSHINSYSLSRPFDVSSRVYAGDDERCIIEKVGDNGPETGQGKYDLEFSSDGKSFFFVSSANGTNANGIFKYNLTSPYDVGSCQFAQQNKTLGDDDMQNGSNAGPIVGAVQKNRPQGVEISDDGTKIFVIQIGHGTVGEETINTRLLEYELSTPFDLDTMSLVLSGGMELEDECNNPMGIRLSSNGKRLWCVDHFDDSAKIVQISLDLAFSTSSFTIDGTVNIANEGGFRNLDQPRGIAFGKDGLKMYIGGDRTIDAALGDVVNEFNLVCPFNIIGGKCPSITENSDRTGMAEAQIELARRTIESATNSTLNRLKWIRRNEDKQNLTNLNIDLNFSNKILNSLTKAVRASTAKKNIKEKEQDVFYWSEGSIAVGRMGNTSISSSKEIETNSLTFGADKFTDNNGIVGLAFRYGRDNTDVGNFGSNLDGDTYNLTFYNTRPSKVDTKYIDTIFGIGKIKTDILTVMDGKHLTANRGGKQMYGTLKIKDEIKKNKLTIIPSSQIDFGHTILNAYDEVGTGAISVKKQHVKSRNLRATVAASHDLENDRYSIKRHGKLEYQANLKRSSEFKYTYVGDRSKSFSEKLAPGSFHNINGEIGIDIVFPENYSIFIIYERNQALDYGHTDNIHIALGYLPNKDTEYAFKIEGSENLISKFEIKKDINGFDLSFNLNDDLTNLGDAREAYIELNKVF